MLEQLFGSKTRTKLLRLFLNNPDTAYYVRELTRCIDTQINSVRRELKNLIDCEIIKEIIPPKKDSPVSTIYPKIAFNTISTEPADGEEKQIKKYFKINPDFLLYNELKTLFIKSQLLLEKELVQQLKEVGNIDYLAMTGFFVGLTDAPTDLLIIGDIAKDKLTKLIKKFEEDLAREINYTILTPKEFHFRKNVTDKFLFSVLECKKVVIIDNLENNINKAST